jgi:hemerythrin-like domain-containing protein
MDQTTQNPGRATQPLRDEHAELRRHVRQIEATAGRLRRLTPSQQRNAVQEVVSFLQGELRPHAVWEESVLYPVVDRQSGGGEPFTGPLRREHRLIERWTVDLAREAAVQDPDIDRFAGQLYRLIGLLIAHFDAEEEVLLPLLERTMSREDLERDVIGRMPAKV